MRKNAFTLIELLAVIVILAIIALIAVPIVVNIINDSKNESGKNSVKLYIDTVQKSIISKNYKTKYEPDECVIQETGKLKCYKDFEEYPEELDIEMKGLKPTSGTIKFENGKIVKIKYLTVGDNYYRYDDGKVYKTQKPPKEAGLYDDNYNMLASWDELVNIYHLRLNKYYNSATYKEKDSGSMYDVLNNNDELKSGTILIVKSGITNISAYVFANCTNLKEIILPETITFISDESFSQCKNLEYINLPDSITYLGSAFSGCTNLESIRIPKNLNYIQQFTFSGCSNLKKVIISDNIRSIGRAAFNYCENLTNIIIPDSVTSIGQHAFAGSGLKSVRLSNNLTTISLYAFAQCKNLMSIVIPNSVKYIGQETFWDCTNLKNVTFENMTGWYTTTSSSATEGTNIDVSNSSTNATNLKNTYRDYY